MNYLEVQNLGAYLPSLQGLSFCLKKGDWFFILGPNGVGKTTLLKTLAFCEHTSIVKNAQGFYLDVNFFGFQELTVEENLQFFSSLYKCPILPTHQLPKKSLIRHLSTGQKRHLSWLIGSMSQADFFLLDEPTLGLDEESKKSFLQSLKAKTVVIATHDEDLIVHATQTLSLTPNKQSNILHEVEL